MFQEIYGNWYQYQYPGDWSIRGEIVPPDMLVYFWSPGGRSRCENEGNRVRETGAVFFRDRYVFGTWHHPAGNGDSYTSFEYEGVIMVCGVIFIYDHTVSQIKTNQRSIFGSAASIQKVFVARIVSVNMPDERITFFCPRCKAPNPGKNQFCTECGALLHDSPPIASLPENPPGTPNIPATPKNRNGIILAVAVIAVIAIVIIGGIILVNGNLPKNGNPDTLQVPQQPAGTAPQPTGQQTVQASRVLTPVATGTSALSYARSTASLSHGVTITVPSDWEKDEVSGTSLRDYGRVTTNIANFYSPDITPERAHLAQPNIDKSRYSSLSIDVDQSPVTDFENYFNLATIALQKYHGSIDITKHDTLLKISRTATFSGYKSYQLDFDSETMRGTYIFTNVEGTIYIFAFRNPSPYSKEVREMYDSIQIEQPSSANKRW
jgi:hypothetical protein